ncbi:hypothetical protein FP744_10000637 [Trichoderma asperellum]
MPYSWDGNFKRSSAVNPFPIVIPSERRNVDFKIKVLKKERQSLTDMPSIATSEKVHDFYTSLMDAMFSFVGVDGSEYPTCFEVCIDVCKATDMYKATNWYTWEGQRNFMRTMGKVDALTRRSNLLHCPAAPDLMVVIALEQVVLHGKIGGRSKISDFIRDFDCYNKATSAICYFQKGNRQDTLTLDQPWDLIPKLQHPPTRRIDQSEFSTSSADSKDRVLVPRKRATGDANKVYEGPPLIQIESPPEHEAEPPAQRQGIPHPMQQARLYDTLESEALLTSPIAHYDTHQDISNTPHQTAPHAVIQAGQEAMNQYISPPVRQKTPFYARQTADFREREREVSIRMSMHRQEPAIIRDTQMQVSRAEVMERLQPLFDRLSHEDWTGRIEDDFMGILTAKSIKVATAEAKGMLRLWASRIRNEVVLSWLEKAQEDLTVFQWIERHEKSTSMTWYSGHIHTVFHDLDMTIAAVLEPTVRDQLRAQVGALRDIIFGKQ